MLKITDKRLSYLRYIMPQKTVPLTSTHQATVNKLLYLRYHCGSPDASPTVVQKATDNRILFEPVVADADEPAGQPTPDFFPHPTVPKTGEQIYGGITIELYAVRLL